MRIALFGGSFDPPHIGHLAIARAAQQALQLDRILFAPVGLQPLKPGGSSASFDDRVAMTRLAIEGEGAFQISLADAPNPSNPRPNYTVETLIELRKSLPAPLELYLLLGADAFRTLHHWHRAAEVPFLANLIVASRPGSDTGDPAWVASSLPQGVALTPVAGETDAYGLSNAAEAHSTLTVLPDLHYEISATDLRSQIHGDTPSVAPAIPAKVLAYIHRHGLYR